MAARAPASFGQSPRRIEDLPILTGQAHYPTDATAPDMAHGFVLRSAAAHGRFRLGNLAEARRAPGVHAILTHDDVAGLGTLPVFRYVRNSDGSDHFVPPYSVLPKDTVRHAGEALAFIVAASLAEARAAAELVAVETDELPVTVDIAHAISKDAPLVWPEHGSNIIYEFALGDAAATEAAFGTAARRITLTARNNRVVANYLEPRSILAVPGQGGAMTATLGCQGVHGMRDSLAAILGLATDKLRVITPDDVGGGFGTKYFVYREYPLAILAALRLGRPVLWIGDRLEHFLADTHGRDNLSHAELALDGEGRFLALKVDLLANMGAYLSEFGASVPAFGAPMLQGLYDIPAAHVRVRAVHTHTAPIDAYRGAGRPEAAYLIERLVDKAARETGLAPDAIRRRNFIKPAQMPYRTKVGRTYDTGEFEGHMSRALDVSDWRSFGERHARSLAADKLRGIGLATYVEACAAGAERGRMELKDDGTAALFIGTQANGQGHRTAYAQIAAAQLGLTLEQIEVVQGDTARVATGGGTGGSKSVPLGAVIVDQAARRLAELIRQRAGEELETAAGDIELAGGKARVKGTDRAIAFARIAAKAAASNERVESAGAFKAPDFTYPNGTHIAEVEIERRTGLVTLAAYWVVDDFGVVVNPLLLQGQIHGGIAQGLGQALFEQTIYDARSGQLLTASFMDYAMPRADDMVPIHFETRNVPSRTNPLGIKGAGEAGTVGACPAIMNAVVDALHRHNGTTHIDMPATPESVWRAIHGLPPRAA